VIWIQEISAVLLVEGRREIAVISAVTSILFHHNSMDTGTYFSVVSIA